MSPSARPCQWMISISYAYSDSVCLCVSHASHVCVSATTQNGETCEWTWNDCSHIQVFPISIATPCTHTRWRLRVLQCMVCRRTIKRNPTRWMMKTWKSFLCIWFYTASLTVRHACDMASIKDVQKCSGRNLGQPKNDVNNRIRCDGI